MNALDQQEDALRSQVTRLEPSQRQYYYDIESQRIKDPDTYAALNYIIVGGLHHFYLGTGLYGLLNMMAMSCGVLTFALGGWILVVLVLLMELPQLLRAQTIVQQHNNQVMAESLDATRLHFDAGPLG